MVLPLPTPKNIQTFGKPLPHFNFLIQFVAMDCQISMTQPPPPMNTAPPTTLKDLSASPEGTVRSSPSSSSNFTSCLNSQTSINQYPSPIIMPPLNPRSRKTVFVQVGKKPVPHKLIHHIIQLRENLSKLNPLAPTPACKNPKSIEGTFPKFAFLPAELRLQIWSYNMPGLNFLHNIKDWDNTWRFENTIRPFVSLQICQESRFEALRSKKLEGYHLLSMEYPGDKFHPESVVPQKAWFDFDSEIYFMTMPNRALAANDDQQLVFPRIPRIHARCEMILTQKLRFLAISSCFMLNPPQLKQFPRSLLPCDGIERLMKVEKIFISPEKALTKEEYDEVMINIKHMDISFQRQSARMSYFGHEPGTFPSFFLRDPSSKSPFELADYTEIPREQLVLEGRKLVPLRRSQQYQA